MELFFLSLAISCVDYQFTSSKETVVFSKGNTFGSVVTVTCTAGYTKDVTSYTATCQANKQWRKSTTKTCTGKWLQPILNANKTLSVSIVNDTDEAFFVTLCN